MDALTSTSAAIKQAAAWGHRAIAITDHGCVQSFTDALHTVEAWGGGPKIAGTDEVIKVLYGCEGYYINDVDDRLAVKILFVFQIIFAAIAIFGTVNTIINIDLYL